MAMKDTNFSQWLAYQQAIERWKKEVADFVVDGYHAPPVFDEPMPPGEMPPDLPRTRGATRTAARNATTGVSIGNAVAQVAKKLEEFRKTYNGGADELEMHFVQSLQQRAPRQRNAKPRGYVDSATASVHYPMHKRRL